MGGGGGAIVWGEGDPHRAMDHLLSQLAHLLTTGIAYVVPKLLNPLFVCGQLWFQTYVGQIHSTLVS